MSRHSIIKDLYSHQLDSSFNSKLKSRNVFSSHLVNNLNFHSELKGHEGCVNCLEWNKTGSVLASGSDDLKINLWDPFRNRLLNSIETKHRGNIFSVKFLPFTGDSLIASAAADRDIYVYDVNKNLNINEIHAHQNRVKRLVTAPDLPFIFWSCGEDGLILQHDIRCPPSSITGLLFNFTHSKLLAGSKNLEAKCISINPVRTEMMAIGLNSPLARVYDRRMISLRSFPNRTSQTTSTTTTSSLINRSSSEKTLFEFCLNEQVAQLPLSYYVPGHLPRRIDEYRKRLKTLSITFITFSPEGNELMVNLGGEQLYSFDLKESRFNRNFLRFDSYKELFDQLDDMPDLSELGKQKKSKLPPRVEELKVKANKCFEVQNFIDAIEYYNQAIELAQNSPILYGNRAASYIKRGWDGDIYEAMRDCYMALHLDKFHMKSHFRLAKCLKDLKWIDEAKECIDIFVKRYPDYASSDTCKNLVNEIASEIKKQLSSKSKTGSGNGKRVRKESFGDNLYLDSDREKDSDSTESSESEPDMNDENEDSQGSSSASSQQAKKKKPAESKSSKLSSADKKLVKQYNELRDNPVDFKLRYSGHCNVATDIKECNYLGENYVCAGSDDGSIFIWNRHNTNIVRVLKGDDSIVNCLQPHPYSCYLASSGIENVVRIWSPKFDHPDDTDETDEEAEKEEAKSDQYIVKDVKKAAVENQSQMNSHPFEYLFMNFAHSQNWAGDEDSPNNQQSVACRTS